VIKFLVPLHVVLVDHVVIVNVQSLALAVIVLDCAGLVFGLSIVIVGAVTSFLIIYVLLFVGHHHVSLILIITFVTHSAGVNHVLKLVPFATQLLPQLNENATAVLGDGHAVSVHVHVIAHAWFHVTLCVKFVQLTIGDGGALVSFLITKLVALTGHHHVSVTLICTVVVHSDGVNAGLDVFVHKLTQLHHVLYSTVIGDGHRLHPTVHTVVPAWFHHWSFVKFVQLTVVGTGALLSKLKLLLTPLDTFHALSYDLHSTLQLFVQSTVQYNHIFIPVDALHALVVHHNVCVAPLNILYWQ